MLSYRRILVAAVLILFFLKLIVVFFYQDQIGVWEDDVIARNMLETGEMFYMQRGTPNYMFQFPVYPSLLFVIYKIFGYNPFYAIVLNLGIISITCFFLYKIFIDFYRLLKVKLMGVDPELIAFLTVLSFLIHPFISFYSMFKVHPFVFDMFFPIAIIFFSFRFLKLQCWKNLCLLAFSTGLGVLNRSTAFSALIPFIILAASSLNLRKTLLSLAVVSFTTVLVITPWLMRGYSLYNSLAMTMTGNEMLWAGSLYNSDGSTYLLNGRTYKTALTLQENEFLHGKSISVQSEFFKKKYDQILLHNPQHIFSMYLIKFKNFWLYHKNIGIEYGDGIQSLLITFKLYVFLILGLNVSAIFFLKFKPFVLLSFPLGIALVQSFFYVETRHRISVEPFLLFFSFITIFIYGKKICINVREKF